MNYLNNILLGGLILLPTFCTASQPALPDDVRINEVQVIGTHNSYHVAPGASLMEIIRDKSGNSGNGLEYTHLPLATQFSELGIRKIELDVRADPAGARFAEPLGLKLAAERGLPTGPAHDANGLLRQPGLKVLHVPDYDFRTTVLTFVDGLQQVRQWSVDHPGHFPIMVMIEVKQGSTASDGSQAIPFDIAQMNEIDREIQSVFKTSEILKPDDVRGKFDTLREAIKTQGWPRIGDVRGKVMFALDNEGAIRDQYLQNHPSLRGRMLFVSVPADHSAAAFMKLNDSIDGFDHIQNMVKQGFLVRTRADVGTRESRDNDPRRRDKAFASGAQFISTDYPQPNPDFSSYSVRFPGGIVVRTNPVNGDPALSGIDLETQRP